MIKESNLIEKVKKTDFFLVAKECASLEYEKFIEKNNNAPYDKGLVSTMISPLRYTFNLFASYALLKAMKNIGQ